MDEALNKVLAFCNVQQLDELLPLLGLAIERVERRGKELICLCPFHDDTNPSFRINIDSGLWHCFACKESGNIVHLLARLNSMPYHDMWSLVNNIKVQFNVEFLRHKVEKLGAGYDYNNCRYSETLRKISTDINARLSRIGLEISRYHRQCGMITGADLLTRPEAQDEAINLVQGQCYLVQQIFDNFASDTDEALCYFTYYRPPTWNLTINDILGFYKQYVTEELAVSKKLQQLVEVKAISK